MWQTLLFLECVMLWGGTGSLSFYFFPNQGLCRKIQRACCQKVPPCPQAYSGAPEALHPGWVSCPHYPTSPPMEHTSTYSPTSTPPSTSTTTWMAHISLVSGKWTKSLNAIGNHTKSTFFVNLSTLGDYQERDAFNVLYLVHASYTIPHQELVSLPCTVYSDMWRRSAGQDSPVSCPGKTLFRLCSPSKTLNVPGMQHQLLPTAWEERYWTSYIMQCYFDAYIQNKTSNFLVICSLNRVILNEIQDWNTERLFHLSKWELKLILCIIIHKNWSRLNKFINHFFHVFNRSGM